MLTVIDLDIVVYLFWWRYTIYFCFVALSSKELTKQAAAILVRFVRIHYRLPNLVFQFWQAMSVCLLRVVLMRPGLPFFKQCCDKDLLRNLAFACQGFYRYIAHICNYESCKHICSVFARTIDLDVYHNWKLRWKMLFRLCGYQSYRLTIDCDDNGFPDDAMFLGTPWELGPES
jgi:hypothetical protein